MNRIPGQAPLQPRTLEQDIDAATMAFLNVRLRVRDGEFGGAMVAVVEAMRNLTRVYISCRRRHNAEKR